MELDQQFLPEAQNENGFEVFERHHHFNGEVVEVRKPLVCLNLVGKLSAIFPGHQHHVCMTMADVQMHRDRGDPSLLSTVLLIPFQASHLHILRVEDEQRQLKPNMIYAFSNQREHGLIYDNDYGTTVHSKPFSVLHVGFQRSSKSIRR